MWCWECLDEEISVLACLERGAWEGNRQTFSDDSLCEPGRGARRSEVDSEGFLELSVATWAVRLVLLPLPPPPRCLVPGTA